MPSVNPINLAEDREPWDRQSRETVRMYSRFLLFRDLGTTRNLTATANILSDTGDPLKYASIKKISFEYRWAERAQAWDAYQADQERARLTKLRQDMIDRHRKLALGLAGKAASAMQKLLPEDMSPSDIVRFLNLAADMERKALGEPDRVALTGPTGTGPVEVEDLSRLDATERQSRLKQIADELGRRAGRAVPGSTEDDDVDD